MRHVVVEEGLGKESVHGRSQRIAADGPLIVEQYTYHPMTWRAYKDGCGAEQHPAGSENRITRARNGEDRTDAPD